MGHEKTGDNGNVVVLRVATKRSRRGTRNARLSRHKVAQVAAIASHAEPSVEDSLRLVKAFLAIEDRKARASLIDLAECLSSGWLK